MPLPDPSSHVLRLPHWAAHSESPSEKPAASSRQKIPGGTALERWVTKPYLPHPFFLLTQRVETGNQSHFPSYRLLLSALQRDELFLLLLNRLPIRFLWHFYLLSQLTSFSLSGPAESDRAGGNCSGVNYTRGPAWHLLLTRRPNTADTPLI